MSTFELSLPLNGADHVVGASHASAIQLVPRRKRPTQLLAPLIGPFDLARRKLLFLISLGVSFALVVIAAGSLLGNPDEASTRAIASMGPHALATIVLRVPQ